MVEELHKDEWLIILSNFGQNLAYNETLDIFSQLNQSFYRLAHDLRPNEYLKKLESFKQISRHTKPQSLLYYTLFDWKSLRRYISLTGPRLCEIMISSFILFFLLFWRIVVSFSSIIFTQTNVLVILKLSLLLVLYFFISIFFNRSLNSSFRKYLIASPYRGKIMYFTVDLIVFLSILLLICLFLSWDNFIIQNIVSYGKEEDLYRTLIVYYLYKIGVPNFIFARESNGSVNKMVMVYEFSLVSFLWLSYKELNIEYNIYMNIALVFISNFIANLMDKMKVVTNENRFSTPSNYLIHIFLYLYYFVYSFILSSFDFWFLQGEFSFQFDSFFGLMKYTYLNLNFISTLATHIAIITSISKRFTLFFEIEYEDDSPLILKKRYLIFYNKENNDRKQFITKFLRKINYMKQKPGESYDVIDIDSYGPGFDMYGKPNYLDKLHITKIDSEFLSSHRYIYYGHVDLLYYYYGFILSIVYADGIKVRIREEDSLENPLENNRLIMDIEKMLLKKVEYSSRAIQIFRSFYYRKAVALFFLFFIIQCIYIFGKQVEI